MKIRFICSLLFLTIFMQLLGPVSADHKVSEVSEVWGRAVEVPPEQAFYGHRYFIYYVLDNQKYAYPIAVKNNQQEKLLAESRDKLIKISGSVYSKIIVHGEISMNMVYFIPDTISPLTLDTLGVEKGLASDKQRTDVIPNPKPSNRPPLGAGIGGGIHLSNVATEVTIYTAAALLIGNIIADYMKRK